MGEPRVPLEHNPQRRGPFGVRWFRFGFTRAHVVFFLFTALTLAMFVVVDRGVEIIARLPRTSYAEPSLGLELLRRLGWWGSFAGVVGFALLARYGHLLAPWSVWQAGSKWRIFVVVLAGAMVWPLTTYGFNYLLNQAHYETRVMLWLALVLLWWRPVFIFPLLALLYVVMGQLTLYPLGGSILAHKLQVLHVLNLFAAAWLVHAITGNRRADAFWFLTLCLVAGAYWVAFIAKMNIGWISYGHLYHALPAAYAHGWLGFVDATSIVDITRALKPFDPVLQAAVLVFEGGCLLMLSDRRVAVALLGALVVFHGAVFFLYGFLFWTWMLLDAALLAMVLHSRSYPSSLGVFNPHYCVVSMVLIASASLWARPPQLGWFDTRVNYTYKVDAHLADGKRLSLAPQFFTPYEDVFTMASFGYLSAAHPLLVGPYGVSLERHVADALREPIDATALLDLEQRFGTVRFNPARRENFVEFMKQFVSHRNARGAVGSGLYALAPPRQFWSFDGTVPDGTVPVIAITVVERTTYYDDHGVNVIREQDVAHIDIAPPPSARP